MNTRNNLIMDTCFLPLLLLCYHQNINDMYLSQYDSNKSTILIS